MQLAIKSNLKLAGLFALMFSTVNCSGDRFCSRTRDCPVDPDDASDGALQSATGGSAGAGLNASGGISEAGGPSAGGSPNIVQPDAAIDASQWNSTAPDITTSTPTDAGTDFPDARGVDPGVAVLGGACSEDARACAGHAQQVQLTCSEGKWVEAGVCNPGSNCDTHPANRGLCATIVEECQGTIRATSFAKA